MISFLKLKSCPLLLHPRSEGTWWDSASVPTIPSAPANILITKQRHFTRHYSTNFTLNISRYGRQKSICLSSNVPWVVDHRFCLIWCRQNWVLLDTTKEGAGNVFPCLAGARHFQQALCSPHVEVLQFKWTERKRITTTLGCITQKVLVISKVISRLGR